MMRFQQRTSTKNHLGITPIVYALDGALDIYLPTSFALLTMLLKYVLASNSTLDLRFLLDMLRHNDRRLGKVV